MGREREGARDFRMKERVKTELSAICKRNERNRKRERERKGEREGGSTRARGCQAYITEKGKGPLGEEVGEKKGRLQARRRGEGKRNIKKRWRDKARKKGEKEEVQRERGGEALKFHSIGLDTRAYPLLY